MSGVPTWEHFLAPSLRVLADGDTHRARDIREAVSAMLQLTDGARAELIPSGQARWENRALWALSYLGRYGGADRPARGQYRITDEGRALLDARPSFISARDLAEFLGEPATAVADVTDHVEQTDVLLDPIEQIDDGVARIEADVASDLLSRLHAHEPAFFESAVLELLLAMGYGGVNGRATRTQLVGDGGIDGIIDQDALGLSRVYVQAKRYAPGNGVGRPEIQAFVGALHGNAANQGVFITTGRFSAGASTYVAGLPTRVVLIDGERLASLMINFEVGVQVRRTLKIVEVDEDFFE